jgi:hypothetical protein
MPKNNSLGAKLATGKKISKGVVKYNQTLKPKNPKTK